MLARGVLSRSPLANVRNELVGPTLEVPCLGGIGDPLKSFSEQNESSSVLQYSSLNTVGAGDTVRSRLALLERENGSQLLGPGRVEDGGGGVCCSRGWELIRAERRGEGVVVSVLVLLISSSLGHVYFPFTLRCPAIRVPQL